MDEIVRVAGKPQIDLRGDLLELRVPLDGEPDEKWRRLFKGLPGKGVGSCRIEGSVLVLQATPLQVVDTLKWASRALDEANRQYQANPVEAEIEAWWAAREGKPRHQSRTATTSTDLGGSGDRQRRVPSDEERVDAGHITEPSRAISSPISPSANGAGSEHGKARRWDISSLGLGIASIFLGSLFGLLPIVTVGVSIVALNRSPARRKGKWKAWAGLACGVVYFFMYLYSHGYLGAAG